MSDGVHIGHDRQLYCNGRTDRDVAWNVDSLGSRNYVSGAAPDPLQEDMPVVDILDAFR